MHSFADLRLILRARGPLVIVETHEERKLVAEIERIAREWTLPFFVWSAADGLVHRSFAWREPRGDVRWGTAEGYMATPPPKAAGNLHPFEGTNELRSALAHVDGKGEAGVYVFCDAHPFLEDPIVRRLLREIVHHHAEISRTIVLVSPQIELPAELKRVASRLSVPVPDATRVRELLKAELDLYAKQAGERAKGDPAIAELLATHLTGLPEDDVQRLARHAIRDDGILDRADVARLIAAKRELLGGTGIELALEGTTLDDVAGMPRLKAWLAQRRAVFVGEPGAPALDPPRGVLLLGVQGAGKSLAAKAIAGSFGVPLLRLDLAALYSKWAGETERQLREALATAENMAPAVVWIDEIEKAIASGSDDHDGGVSRRVLGTLLTWMAERNSRVFVAATANDIERLPPELLRKGRFDEIFFVDLPDPAVRATIFRLHFSKRTVGAGFDVEALARSSEGYSGAEIEQAIVSALYAAHARSEALKQRHVEDALMATKPLSTVMAERVAALRAWARDRTVPA